MEPAGMITELAALGTTPETQVAGLDHRPPVAVAVATFATNCVIEKVPGQGL